MKLLCTAVFTLAITTASFADIYQYSDCDGNGTLLLTELDAEPGVDLSGHYLGCADLFYANLAYANLTDADLTDVDLYNADLTDADLTGVSSGGISGRPWFLPTNWQFTKGYLIGPQANLYNADLSGANLSGANLENADLYSHITHTFH